MLKMAFPGDDDIPSVIEISSDEDEEDLEGEDDSDNEENDVEMDDEEGDEEFDFDEEDDEEDEEGDYSDGEDGDGGHDGGLELTDDKIHEVFTELKNSFDGARQNIVSFADSALQEMNDNYKRSIQNFLDGKAEDEPIELNDDGPVKNPSFITIPASNASEMTPNSTSLLTEGSIKEEFVDIKNEIKDEIKMESEISEIKCICPEYSEENSRRSLGTSNGSQSSTSKRSRNSKH